MQNIGRIILLQIQPASIKVGESEYYDPTQLLIVDELLLSQPGVIGVTSDGQHIIDIHNANHPHSKSRGDNGFSIGFTSHYDAMRSRFGEHLVDGCAGENITIETDRTYQLADLRDGLAIQQVRTGAFIFLTDVASVIPCLPFSNYASQRTLAPYKVKETLQFLMHGRRGFLAELMDKGQTASVRAGDMLFRM
ncbi:MAG: hypothetical protein NVS4B11_07730 [Ktedonobacteraceae bacterium]